MSTSDPKSPPAPNSALVRVHKISIAAAIVLGVVYTAYSARAYASSGASQNLFIAALTGAVTLGLAAYLFWFSKKRS